MQPVSPKSTHADLDLNARLWALIQMAILWPLRKQEFTDISCSSCGLLMSWETAPFFSHPLVDTINRLLAPIIITPNQDMSMSLVSVWVSTELEADGVLGMASFNDSEFSGCMHRPMASAAFSVATSVP